MRTPSKFAVVAGLAALAAAGCGPARGDVEGQVRHAGRPLVFGSVLFVGDDNLPVQALIGPDGRYRARGVPAGTARVAVFSPDPVRTGSPAVPGWFPVPERYADVGSSGLTVTVARGTNRGDLELE